jgi:hypothetical protein
MFLTESSKVGVKLDKRWAAVAAMIWSVGAAYAQPAPAPASGASGAAVLRDDTAPARPLKPNPEFAKLQRYEGTLGGRPIVVHLGPKQDEPGVHGEYQYRDTGEVVLLAGDRDGDTLEIEESNDGTNITGVWIGHFDATTGALSADRMNSDESDPQPVVLHPVGGAPTPPPARQPSPPSVQQPVGGVSNLSTAP